MTKKISTNYYKMIKSHFVTKSLLIVENSIIICNELELSNKSKTTMECFCQGSEGKLSIHNFYYLLKNKLVIEIKKPSDSIIYGYVIPSKSFLERKKIIGLAKKELPEYKSILNTLSTWVFATKGSNAVNYNTELNFQKDKEKVLSQTTFRDGMKSKPGSPCKNRSTRQTVVCDEKKWSLDESSLLPNGIRQSDSASYEEVVSIFDKLVSEIISMKGTPKKVISFFEKCGYSKFNEIHIDYFYKTPISWKEFEKNTHHAKVKGVEFCHINPELEFTTQAKNVTIGLCESNRHQGGYGLDYTYNKIIIKKIYECNISKDVEYLNSLSIKQLETIYFEKK